MKNKPIPEFNILVADLQKFITKLINDVINVLNQQESIGVEQLSLLKAKINEYIDILNYYKSLFNKYALDLQNETNNADHIDHYSETPAKEQKVFLEIRISIDVDEIKNILKNIEEQVTILQQSLIHSNKTSKNNIDQKTIKFKMDFETKQLLTEQLTILFNASDKIINILSKLIADMITSINDYYTTNTNLTSKNKKKPKL